jgi:hypothetical protein
LAPAEPALVRALGRQQRRHSLHAPQ